MKAFLSAFVLMLLTICPAMAKESYEYPGRWKVLDENKKEYSVYLNLGGSAQSDKGQGQIGSWTFADGGVMITWMDGTKDLIRKGPNGYGKMAFSNNAVPASPAEKME